MKNMFAGDAWYNVNQQPSGVQGMGFRPTRGLGPVQLTQMASGMTPPVFQGPMSALPLMQSPGSAPVAPALSAPPMLQRPQHAPAQPARKGIPMGTKADCPVCRSFGGR